MVDLWKYLEKWGGNARCWLDQSSHVAFRLCEGRRRRKSSIWGKMSLKETCELIWVGPQWHNFFCVSFKLQIVEVRRRKIFLHQQNSRENNWGAWPWTEQGECYCLETSLWMFIFNLYFTLFILYIIWHCFKGCHVLDWEMHAPHLSQICRSHFKFM